MRAVVASDSVEQLNQIRVLILGTGIECGAPDCVSLQGLTDRLMQGAADLAFVEVVEDSASAINAIQNASNKSQTPILAIGPSQNSKMIMHTLRSGAQEFLDQDNLREELVSVLDKLRKVGAVKGFQGNTFAVIGANPGCGVTTVALNLAFALRQANSQPTALAELGWGVPELALALDVKPTNSIVDILRVWDRLDATLMHRALVEHENGVHLLAYAQGTLQCQQISPDVVRQICVLLRSMFAYSVFDMGHVATESTLEALRVANKVVLVVRMDAPALNLTRQLLRHLSDNNIDLEKVVVIGNRYGQRRQIPWKKVEEVLHLPVQTWIPDDPGSTNESLNNGQPLFVTAPRTTITKRFSELAKQVVAKAS